MQARYRTADIVVHHHPALFPHTPYSLEVFSKTPEGNYVHYLGTQLEQEPTPEFFREYCEKAALLLLGKGEV